MKINAKFGNNESIISVVLLLDGTLTSLNNLRMYNVYPYIKSYIHTLLYDINVSSNKMTAEIMGCEILGTSKLIFNVVPQ